MVHEVDSQINHLKAPGTVLVVELRIHFGGRLTVWACGLDELNSDNFAPVLAEQFLTVRKMECQFRSFPCAGSGCGENTRSDQEQACGESCIFHIAIKPLNFQFTKTASA